MTLMLLDAAGLYFRAFHGIPTSVTAPDGSPINAVRGYLDMTATLITRRRPTRLVSCQDVSWRPQFRVDLLPSYKAHRVASGDDEIVPAELVPQIPVLFEVLDAIGLARAGARGFEADDVLATLAAGDDDVVEIVSGDRDLFSTVTDRVHLLYVGRGVSKLQDFGPAEVLERYGIPAANYADFAALRGDPSDGLPGVPGVGDKTAAVLVRRFGAVEAMLTAAQESEDGFPSGARGRILAAADYLSRAPGVVRVRTDAPLDPIADALPTTVNEPDRLVRLCDRYGIDSSVNRLLTAIGMTGPAGPAG
ncbi:MAG: 5'-3' exonuclease [Actinomycetota bacterium]|nr:5'-3' exonuclease [Actinomycetota bacterium]